MKKEETFSFLQKRQFVCLGLLLSALLWNCSSPSETSPSPALSAPGPEVFPPPLPPGEGSGGLGHGTSSGTAARGRCRLATGLECGWEGVTNVVRDQVGTAAESISFTRNGSRQTLTGAAMYNKFGYDPACYRRTLWGVDPVKEDVLAFRFDAMGYNCYGQNFLGLSKETFQKEGYRGLVSAGLVPEKDADLLNTFSKECWNLKQAYQGIYGDLPDTDEALYDGLRESERAVSGRNLSTPQIQGFLRTGIAFCRFLKKGGTQFPEVLGNQVSVHVLRLTQESLRDIHWQQLYTQLVPEMGIFLKAQGYRDLNVYDQMKAYFKFFILTDGHPSLHDVSWLEDANKHDDRWNSIEKVFRVYESSGAQVESINGLAQGPGGAEYWKGKYQLALLVRHYATLGVSEKTLVLQYLMHAGTHCHNAKREALKAIYSILTEIDPKTGAKVSLQDRIDAKHLQLQGSGLENQVRSVVWSLKLKKFHDWVHQAVLFYNASSDVDPKYKDEVTTPTAALLIKNADRFGIEADGIVLGSMDPFSSWSKKKYAELSVAQFFTSVQEISPVRGRPAGGFTVGEIQKQLAINPVLLELEKEVWGPLQAFVLKNKERDPVLSVKPWIIPLLIRLGIVVPL